jgi:DNA-directed RNA polymerase subunit N (RpoN/RPB10)
LLVPVRCFRCNPLIGEEDHKVPSRCSQV